MASDDDLEDRVPDSISDDIEIYTKDEEEDIVYGSDAHGEFELDPMRGDPEPQEGRCGVPLRDWRRRYGEIRYCGAMKVGTFPGHNYEHDEYCKNHQGRHQLMEQAHELFKHGYFATNFVKFAGKLNPAKFLFAVEIFGGLLKQSNHDFEVARETRTIDTSETGIIYEDSVEVELPIPTSNTLSFQANELWTAALKEVMTQNMQEVVFEDGMSTRTLTESADMEGQITDTHYERDEHHLHLPISRLAKDIKEHLQNGGVVVDDDGDSMFTFEQNDYTLSVEPAEPDGEEADDMRDVGEEFSAQLQAETDEDAAEIELE